MERPIFPEQQVWAGLSSSPQRLRLVPVLAPEKKLRVLLPAPKRRGQHPAEGGEPPPESPAKPSRSLILGGLRKTLAGETEYEFAGSKGNDPVESEGLNYSCFPESHYFFQGLFYKCCCYF